MSRQSCDTWRKKWCNLAHLYWKVTPAEEKKILYDAENKNRMSKSATHNIQQTVIAKSNLQDVVSLISILYRNRELLLHCAVYIKLTAYDPDALKLLQSDVLTELIRSKFNVDRLLLRQKKGFLIVGPAGYNLSGMQFEKILPASSVADPYLFNYSGKADVHGLFLGWDKFGLNIIVDFDKHDDDKTNAIILILGNSGLYL